jgi:hypothetical protein
MLTALASLPGFDIATITVQENVRMGDKAKPLAAYRRRLCCLAASYITALVIAILRDHAPGEIPFFQEMFAWERSRNRPH